MRRSGWMYLIAVLVIPAAVSSAISCAGSLDPAAAKDLRHARTLNGLAYQRVGAATAQGADIRGAYCAVTAVLETYNIDGGTDDSGIVCKH